jgi:hypothetical protein
VFPWSIFPSLNIFDRGVEVAKKQKIIIFDINLTPYMIASQ